MMVYVFCLNEKCRRIIHLDSHKHQDFKGKIKCVKCGAAMEAEIKGNKLKSLTGTERK